LLSGSRMGAKDINKSGGVIPFDHKDKGEWTLILCNFECDKQRGRRQTAAVRQERIGHPQHANVRWGR
jgi:hypothetical protein